MAFRITATTTDDRQLLDQFREWAYLNRKQVSEGLREAFAMVMAEDDNALAEGYDEQSQEAAEFAEAAIHASAELAGGDGEENE